MRYALPSPPPRPMTPSAYVDAALTAVVAKPVTLMPPPLPLVPALYGTPPASPPLAAPAVREELPPPRNVLLTPSTAATLPPALTLAVPSHASTPPIAIAPAPFSAREITEIAAPAPRLPVVEAAPSIQPVTPPPSLRIPVSPAERLQPLQGVPPPESLTAKPSLIRRALKFVALAAAGYLALVVGLIFLYRFVDPPMSSLMIQKGITGQSITYDWIDIGEMSPQVVRAVLLSEDGRFCDHYGIDYEAIQDAIERAGDGTPRGASTISMQVVKNLFLWPSKSYLRKAIEVPLTYLMEFVWPKWRIMEIYMNIAEWGPGVFGIEAASQYHFEKSARRLSGWEAARLAVALPNPIRRDAGDPGPQTMRLASDIQARMRAAPASQTACVLIGRKN